MYYKALGTVTALNTINVRSRVGGELVKIAFEEGQMVKAGDLLAEIDPRSYQNALLQAQGTLLQNQAQLKNAQVDVQRYRDLYAQDSIAKQTLTPPKRWFCNTRARSRPTRARWTTPSST